MKQFEHEIGRNRERCYGFMVNQGGPMRARRKPGCSLQMAWRAVGLATALLAIAVRAGADVYVPPPKEHWSRNRQYVLKVDSNSWGQLSLWRQAEAGTNQIWAHRYGGSVLTRAYVANDGQHVVLMDAHPLSGSGRVFDILGPQGEAKATYALKDFLPEEEFELAFGGSRWARNAWLRLINRDTQFAVVSENGTIRCFDLRTGKLMVTDELQGQIRKLAVADATLWANSGQSGDRIRGLVLLGGLRERAAIPLAKSLLKDQTETVRGGGYQGKPAYLIFGVQIAAAGALLRLTEAEAVPLIEAEITSANWRMQQELVKTLTRFERVVGPEAALSYSQALQALWQRSLNSPATELRDHALVERLKREDGAAYLYAHPELIESGSDNLRSQALTVLAADRSPQAEPLLRRALRAPNRNDQHTALALLVHRQATNLEPVLMEFLEKDDAFLHFEALKGLVNRRHPKALAMLKVQMRSWKDHSDETPDNEPAQRWQLDTLHPGASVLCYCIAEMNLQEVKPLLEEVWVDACRALNVVVSGALAVLGHEAAQARLHALVADEQNPRSSDGFRYLALLGDEESIRLLTQASQSKNQFRSMAARAWLDRDRAGQAASESKTEKE